MKKILFIIFLLLETDVFSQNIIHLKAVRGILTNESGVNYKNLNQTVLIGESSFYLEDLGTFIKIGTPIILKKTANSLKVKCQYISETYYDIVTVIFETNNITKKATIEMSGKDFHLKLHCVIK